MFSSVFKRGDRILHGCDSCNRITRSCLSPHILAVGSKRRCTRTEVSSHCTDTVRHKQAQEVVEVYFKSNDVVTKAMPGENFMEVANRCDVNISSGCLSGSCGMCEIEVTKHTDNGSGECGSTSIVRACIANVPPGFKLIEVDDVVDNVWGVDGMDL